MQYDAGFAWLVGPDWCDVGYCSATFGLDSRYGGRPLAMSPALNVLTGGHTMLLSDSPYNTEVRIPISMTVETTSSSGRVESNVLDYSQPVSKVMNLPMLGPIIAFPMSQSPWVTSGSYEAPALEMKAVVHVLGENDPRIYYEGYQPYVTSQSYDLQTGTSFKWGDSHFHFE